MQHTEPDVRAKNCFIIVMIKCYLPLGLASWPFEGPALAPYPFQEEPMKIRLK